MIIYANGSINSAPLEVRNYLYQFPVVFLGSGQLTYHLQFSDYLLSQDGERELRAHKLLLLSELDRSCYGQFGVTNSSVIFNPVVQRSSNEYASAGKYYAYVGRIKIFIKGIDRLVNFIQVLKERGQEPFLIFTSDDPIASQDLENFRSLLIERGLIDSVEFIFGLRDKYEIFSKVKALVLPSRLESFGNVILEAFSFGVPVIASRNVPGPETLIQDGLNGILVEDFNLNTIESVITKLDDETLVRMSKEAFDSHKYYSFDRYYSELEKICHNLISRSKASEPKRVFPNVFPKVVGMGSVTLEKYDRLGKRYNRLKKIALVASIPSIIVLLPILIPALLYRKISRARKIS